MAVRLQQLKKRFIGPDGSIVPVVDVDSFELADGEQVALIGTSGSGKTTLLHLIAGILTPDSVRILFGPSADMAAEPVPTGSSAIGSTLGSDVLDYRTPGSA